MEIDALHATRALIIMTRNHRLSPLPTRSCNTQQHMFINASQLCMFVLARVSTPININCIFVGERFYAYLTKVCLSQTYSVSFHDKHGFAPNTIYLFSPNKYSIPTVQCFYDTLILNYQNFIIFL